MDALIRATPWIPCMCCVWSLDVRVTVVSTIYSWQGNVQDTLSSIVNKGLYKATLDISEASTPCALDVTSHYVSLLTGDELLCHFWEVECCHQSLRETPHSITQRKVCHPSTQMTRSMFQSLMSQGLSLWGFLIWRGVFKQRDSSTDLQRLWEKTTLNHAESVPVTDLHRPSQQVFYMPMHAVHKELSTTTNIRVVWCFS